MLQPFLQERKHFSNRASSGVFSARITPIREQTPLQCVGLPCLRSSSLSDGLYHCSSLPRPVHEPHMEVPQIWMRVPYGAKPLREEVLSQRNVSGSCCRKEN